jgi:hypothetical protein
MNQPQATKTPETASDAASQQPAYVPPRIVTYTSEELLEQVGPALTCSPNPCPLPGPTQGSAPKR